MILIKLLAVENRQVSRKKKQDDSDVNWRRVGTEIYFLWIWFGDG